MEYGALICRIVTRFELDRRLIVETRVRANFVEVLAPVLDHDACLGAMATHRRHYACVHIKRGTSA